MAATETTLELDDLRLAAKVWGPSDGQRALALHGWLDNAASFDRLAPLLPELRLVALDLPGHALSDQRPPGAAYHFIDFVADVIGAADALGWDDLILIGHSMGAGIATLVAGAYPERIARLVLLEGLGPLSAAAPETPARLAATLAKEAGGNGPPRLFPDLASAVRARRKGTDLDRAAAELLVDRGTAAERDGVRFRHDPRLKMPSRVRLTEDQVIAFLAAIRCPTLAIRAREGWPFPAHYVEPRLAAIRDLATVAVEGGHHVHLTHGERVAPPVRAFLGL